MRLLDSRRLTGPNLMTRVPAVIAEVAFDDGDAPAHALEGWRRHVRVLLDAVGIEGSELFVREHRGGAALVFTAPLDVLLPATDVNEFAVAAVIEELAGRPTPALEPRLSELRAMIEAARSPALLALQAEAAERRVPFLLDDKALTLGMTARSATWPKEQLPTMREVRWEELGKVPVALITGTNGKTTSTRLAARIAKAAGLIAGVTSTDGVVVNGEVVERGDYTGPAGALAVLRRPEVEIAILETARGGILRRGLAVESCEAALITNVSADHLGDYGIDDVETMVEVKSVIGRVAEVVVLNAEDPGLVRAASTFPGRVVFFAANPESPVLAAHRRAGGEVWTVEHETIVRYGVSGREPRTELARLSDVPLTFGGRARYNVENALGAAALAAALGLPDEAIRLGLRSFTSSDRDNPGRGNLFEVGDARVLVDFGHNPAGLQSVLGFARALAGDDPLTVVFGMPGDRLDEELEEVAHVLASVHPTRVILRDLEHYLRGREPGVVPAILERALVSAGVPHERVTHAPNEATALARALDEAAPRELVVTLPHVEHEAVAALLAARGAVSGGEGSR